MTVHLHIDRVVVDGPLPGDRHAWREALARELTTVLAGHAPAAGLHTPALPPAYLPPATPTTPTGRATPATPVQPGAVAGAVGAALSTTGGGRP